MTDQWINCPGCQRVVQKGQLRCSVCGKTITWPIDSPVATVTTNQTATHKRKRNWEIFRMTGARSVNEDGISRQAILLKCKPGDTVSFIHQPQPGSEYYVGIYTKDGEQIGYVHGLHEYKISHCLDNGEMVHAEIDEIIENKTPKGTYHCMIGYSCSARSY